MSPSPEPPASARALEPDVGQPDVLDTPSAGPAALRGSALRTGGYVLGLLLSLVSAPLLIRHLGQAEFGRYVAVVSVVTVAAGLTEGGLNAIALREYATLRGPGRDRLMADVLGLRIVLSIVAVTVAVAFCAAAGYSSTLVLGALLAGVGMVLQVTQSLLGVSLQASLRFGWVSALDLLRQTVTVALIAAVVLGGAGLLALFAIPIPAGVIALAFTVVLVRGLFPLRPAFRPGAWWPVLRDTIPYAMAIALNTMYFRITIIVMSLTATALETGYFSTSFRVIEVLIGVPSLVIGAAFPILVRAVRDDRSRFAYATGRLFELAVLAGALLSLAIFLGAGFAVQVLGGDEAEPAAAVLRIQGLAMVATFVAVACGFPLLSLRRNRELLIANVVALLASVVMTLALVPWLQAEGAAIAAVSAEFALAAANAVLLVRADRGLRLPVGAVAVASVAGGLGALAGLVVPVHPVVQVLVGGIVYVAVVAVLGRFPPEVRDALRHGRQPADVR